MSSFQQRKTTMNDQEVLVATLKKMGYNPAVSETKQNVRGHYNETRKAEVILKKEDLDQGGDIGFTKDSEGNFTIVTDTYVMKKFDLNKLTKEVNVNYAEEKVMRIARNKGLTYSGKMTTSNGNTRLTFVQA